MSNISMVEAELPPGFRFHPRDEELICDYLMKKVTCCEVAATLMIEVDLNKCEPWQIPEMACVGGKEWYFYTQRDRKYSIGLRTNRATASGYWKATGKDRPVFRKGTLVGMRKTLVFYQGRAPKGRKTDWVMHEFRIEGLLPHPKVSSVKEDWVLCRVLYKKRETNQSKANMGSLYYNDMEGSSSLPPLFDSYITFDQIAPPNTQEENNNNQYQQVPCFSNFSQNQTNINYDPNFITSLSSSSNIMETNLILDGGGPYSNAPYVCDKGVLKFVLNHLSKIETTDFKASQGLGDANAESYMYL